jgi:hypothetical protein
LNAWVIKSHAVSWAKALRAARPWRWIGWVQEAASNLGGEPVEGIRLWRASRQKLVGMVYLDKGVLDLDIPDDHERALVEEVLEQTGQVTWSFSRFDEGEWQENIAEPRTDRWLWFVVANILYPMGYQADLGISEEGEPTEGRFTRT